MGIIHIDLELANGADIIFNRMGQNVPLRQCTVRALVDTGCMMLAINEDICAQLGLMKVDERAAELADGSIAMYDVVGPVEVRIPRRRCSVDAMVLPGNAEVLLGAIPMEDMDLVISPSRQEIYIDPTQPYVSKKKMK
jgi:clan AA aspartic protease